jgi:amidohydrolase
LSTRLPADVLHRAIALRRDLHAHPELSHREVRTQSVLEGVLRELGLVPVRVANTGLYADIVGDPAGPRVCVRADTDALPLDEETGLPYRSGVQGVMHACGHDVHAASAWAAAAMLVRDPPPGVVRVLFQPAEERGEGAAACVADGAMDGMGAVLGGHVDLDYPVGTVALQAGAVSAGTEQFRVMVAGRAAHGARPHQGIDAILAASQLVVALQGVVAREIAPGAPAVLTVGTFHAGERANILAGTAILEGTMRACDDGVRAQLSAALARIAAGVAAATGTEIHVDSRRGHDPVVNDATLARALAPAFEAASLSLVRLARPNTGGEDFGELTRDRPGIYVRWGCDGPGASSAPAHSTGFCPDEGVIDAAAAGFAAAARAAVGHLAGS